MVWLVVPPGSSFVSGVMLSRNFITGIVIFMGLALGRPGAAQTAPERLALEGFRDSLAVITDTISLHKLEASLIAQARTQRNNPMLHLRLGFLALRMGDFGVIKHYDDAASEFQWVVDLRPSWPYGWFGLGLAEFAMGDTQVRGRDPNYFLGRDAMTRSSNAYLRAAILDPGFATRLEILASQALRRRDDAQVEVVRLALRNAVQSQPPGNRSGSLLLALGRVERESGDLPAALNAFETYRRVGDNRSLGHLEVARTRFLMGDLSGTEDYYTGLAGDDLMALTAYRADLEVVAPDSVLAVFDRLRGAERAQAVATFWELRDQLDFRDPGSRLSEHYRRLAYARRLFSSGRWSLPSDPVYLSTDAQLDDRGRIYVRHGEPDSRVNFTSVGVEPNESWHYRRAGGDLVFHFVARQDPERFRLVQSLLDIVDVRSQVLSSATSAGSNRLPDGAAKVFDPATEQLVRSRAGFATVYSELGPQANRREGTASTAADRERALVATSIETGLRTDSYEPRYRRDLAARLHAVTARAPDGGVAHLLLAVPGFGLQAVRGSDGYTYPLRVKFTAVDLTGSMRASLDTTIYVTMPVAVRPDQYLEGHIDLPVPEGVTMLYRMGLFSGPDGGSLSPIDTIAVVPQTSDILRIGDLILAPEHSALESGGLVFGPMQSMSRSEPLLVQAELSGVPGDGRVRGVLELRDPETGELVFSDDFSGKVGGGGYRGLLVRKISVKKAPPGRYAVRLLVTDLSGREAGSSQRLQLTVP